MLRGLEPPLSIHRGVDGGVDCRGVDGGVDIGGIDGTRIDNWSGVLAAAGPGLLAFTSRGVAAARGAVVIDLTDFADALLAADHAEREHGKEKEEAGQSKFV